MVILPQKIGNVAKNIKSAGDQHKQGSCTFVIFSFIRKLSYLLQC